MISIEKLDNLYCYINFYYLNNYYSYLNLKNKLNHHILKILVYLYIFQYHTNIQHKIILLKCQKKGISYNLYMNFPYNNNQIQLHLYVHLERYEICQALIHNK